MKRVISLIVSLFLIPLLASLSCSPAAEKAPSQKEAAPPNQIQPAKQGWEATWEKWGAEAKKESKLVIYGTAKPLVHQAITRGFKQAFGVEIELLSGRSAEIQQKILSEYRSGLYLPDIWMAGGADVPVFVFRPADMTMDMDPLIIHPDVRDDKVWYNGSFARQFNDPWNTSFTFIAAPDTPLAVNNSMVKPDEIKSLDDLLDPKWKGKLILNDPTTDGKGNQSFVMIGWKIRSWDYWKAIAKQEPVILRDARLATDWLAKGKYPVLISPSSSAAQEFLDAGAPIALVRFAGEGYVSHSGGSIVLLKKAPHPNAGKVFLNWLLTKEGQTLWSRADGTQSARIDVPTDHLNPNMRRNPNIKYYSTSEWDYVSRDKEKDFALAREIFGMESKR